MSLGLPSISVKFIQEGMSAIKRGKRGIVGMIIKEENVINPPIISDKNDIPELIKDRNKNLIKNALIGNTNAPLNLKLYVIPTIFLLSSAALDQ